MKHRPAWVWLAVLIVALAFLGFRWTSGIMLQSNILALLPPTERPCQGVSPFFDGKQRYDLVYGFKGAAPPEARERQLGLIDTVRCSLVYREVAGFKRKPAEQRNQGLRRDVTVGMGRLGPGGPWLVSYLRAETVFGAAEIDLERARLGADP